MTHGTFREWARAEGIEISAGVDQLKNATIAIDAEEYLHHLLTANLTREPLLPALGGLPFALESHVESDIKNYRESGITPWFIFTGLDIAVNERSSISRLSRKATGTLNEAWAIYDQGRGDDAVVAFGRACTYKTYHIVRWLQAYLHRSGVFVQTAPYTAAAQMSYLLNENIVDAVLGSASCLVFGVDSVITNVDWEVKRFTWVEAEKCLSKTLLGREQFSDLLLLSGCSILAPLPELDGEPAMTRIAAARSLLSRYNQDGHAVCLQAKDEDFLAAFRKARFAVKHPVILDKAGRVEPRNGSSVPNDVHEFIGQRLPEELYFYLSRGVAGPRVLNWRTRMQVFETPPLDGGSSQAYRDLVQDKLRPLRAQSLALISRLLHRYYLKTDVDLVCWFKDDEKMPLGIPDIILAEPSAAADTWHVQGSAVAGLDQKTSPLRSALNALSEDTVARTTVTPRTEASGRVLSQPSELVANTVWRFLQDSGYLNHDHTLSAWGKTLKNALDHAQSEGYLNGADTGEREEAILMAFELLRVDVLNAKGMFPTSQYSGQPLRGNETDKAHTLLISRIACLARFKHNTIGYTGPLSRHLLAYHQMTTAVRGALRDLLEVHACNLLLSGAVDRSIDETLYTDLAASLPFVREPDLGLALVVKSYLDELSNDPAKRADITKWFNHASDIHGDLERMWKLWAAINAGVQAADSSIIDNETRKLFKNADEWLQRKLANAPKTNGTA